MSKSLQIEVVYCPSGQAPMSRTITVQAGCIASQAIEQSLLLTKAGLAFDEGLLIGIYGKQCASDTPLHDQDRVEIYRPLLLSPTEARRLRAQTLAEK